MKASILHGHVLDVLRTLPDQSIQCCVTSPPYWGLRSYGTAPQVWGGLTTCDHKWGEDIFRSGPSGKQGSTSQRARRSNVTDQGRAGKSQGRWCQVCGAWRGELGAEPTQNLYVEHTVSVFREVRRVLRKDGTLWLNLGDSYATGAGSARVAGGKCFGKSNGIVDSGDFPACQPNRLPQPDLKPKDLCGIPWRVAFALQADGWYLRSDIIWAKPNPMPESVTDRPTKAHEYVFLLAKSERYFYDADAIREPHAEVSIARARRNRFGGKYKDSDPSEHGALKSGNGYGPDGNPDIVCHPAGRNSRSVWTIATQPFPGAHFATFPTALVEPCIKAGCPEGGTVLDPFTGSGTTGLVAVRLSRKFIGVELNSEYFEMAKRRIFEDDDPALVAQLGREVRREG